jgi:DNA polymerase-4
VASEVKDWPRAIAHLDMDAFYASVELRRRPELRGKPVIVCGSGPRAVVTTASYEARKLAGIHSAMPAATARRRLPDAVYLTPDFPAYREASGEVMEVLRSNVETVEVVGLDEAYLDLTGLFSPKATMRRVAAEIREVTGGLTCSVGISESRLLAKITSELGKPSGLVVLSRQDALARFAEDSPGLVPGIGPKTLQRLGKMGVTTLAQLREDWPREELEARFGPRSGAWLHSRARLEDQTPVSTSRETKSQSAETTFDYDVADLGQLERQLGELAEELCRRLRKRDLTGRSIGIKVRLDDWTNVSRSHSVGEPTNDPEVVRSLALGLLRAYDPPRPVRLLGVRVASFEHDAEAEGRTAAEGPDAEAAEGETEPQLRLSLPS